MRPYDYGQLSTRPRRSYSCYGVAALAFFVVAAAVLIGFLPSYLPLKSDYDSLSRRLRIATFDDTVEHVDPYLVLHQYCYVSASTLVCGENGQPVDGFPITFKQSVHVGDNLFVKNTTQSIGDINSFSRLKSDGGVDTKGDIVTTTSVKATHVAAGSSVQSAQSFAMTDDRVWSEDVSLADGATCLSTLNLLVVQVATARAGAAFIPASPANSYIIQAASVNAGFQNAYSASLKNPQYLGDGDDVVLPALKGVDMHQISALLVCAVQELAGSMPKRGV